MCQNSKLNNTVRCDLFVIQQMWVHWEEEMAHVVLVKDSVVLRVLPGVQAWT